MQVYDDTMRGATLMMGVHHSIFTDAAMANSVLQILYKSCKIQKVVLHKLKNRLASMAAEPRPVRTKLRSLQDCKPVWRDELLLLPKW